MTDCDLGCICSCRRGMASTRGGKCMRCKVGDMAPGLTKMIATALLPVINSDLPEYMTGGEVWPAAARALRDADGPGPDAAGTRAPAADMEIGG